MSLFLLGCQGDDCSETTCTDSFTFVFDGGGLLETYKAELTDETGRQESFKCYGLEVENLTDDSLLVWCEDEGFTVAGWSLTTVTLAINSADGTTDWELSPTWEPVYPQGDECPAACQAATETLILEAVAGDSGDTG